MESTTSKSASSVVDIKKKQNISSILSILYFDGPLTIANLAKTLHTSVPSVTSIINELILDEWLIETGSIKTKTGRRPSQFDLNPNKKTFTIIDINVYSSTFYLINIKNEILAKEIFEQSITDSDILNKTFENLKSFEKTNGVSWAVGASIPGLISAEQGINFTYPNLNHEGVSFAKWISAKIEKDVFVLHDTKASMIGEHHFGLAKDKKDVLLINLDWGIGLGVLTNGDILKGTDGFAGELGHIQVNPNGELCHCGKIGCLETIASAVSLLKRVQHGIDEGKASILSKIKGKINLEDIIESANKGDEFSIDILFDIGRELGKGLSIAVHLFNPKIIIIDGILSNAGDLIVSTLQQSLNKYCLSDFKKNLEITISPLGDYAKIFGVKSYIFEKMLIINSKN